jgi:photosystem II stability/assembly factor-like uncharacterized protein
MSPSQFFSRLVVGLFLCLAASKTSQAQAQWQFQNTGVNFILTNISFPGNQDSIGYAVGMSSTYNGNGIILKTVDAGNTWVQISTGTLPGLEAMHFVSVDTGYIGGWQNYFAKTTNGGLTWTTSTVNAGIWYIKEIKFFNSLKGIVVAAGSQAFVTNNGGASWTAATGFINAEDVTFVNADTLYAVGGDEKIARSVNGGLNWSTIYTGTFQSIFLGIDFAGPNHGLVVGEDGKVLTTTNGGSSWTVGNVGSTHLLRVAHMFDSLNFLAAGTPEGVFVSSNGGQNWASDFQGGNSYALYQATFTPSGSGFICGSQGRILKKVAVLSADFVVSNDSICAGDSVLFTHNSQGAPTSWEWTFFGGTPATYSGPQPPAIHYANPGIYDFQLIVSNASAADTLFRTALMQVFVANQASISSSTAASAGDTVVYQVPAQANHSYLWTVQGGQLISGQNTRSIEVYWPQSLTGQVQLQLTNLIGCQSVDSLEVIVGAASSLSPQTIESVQLYPNPATNWLEVRSSEAQEPIEISIYDMTGRRMAQPIVQNNRIFIESLSAGTYLLEWKSGRDTWHRKRFIKQ